MVGIGLLKALELSLSSSIKARLSIKADKSVCEFKVLFRRILNLFMSLLFFGSAVPSHEVSCAWHTRRETEVSHKQVMHQSMLGLGGRAEGGGGGLDRLSSPNGQELDKR